MHYLYVLKSKNTDKFYIGATNDISRRVREHNSKSHSYTSKQRPWILVYFEGYRNKKLALIRERKLKNHGKGFQELRKRIL